MYVYFDSQSIQLILCKVQPGLMFQRQRLPPIEERLRSHHPSTDTSHNHTVAPPQSTVTYRHGNTMESPPLHPNQMMSMHRQHHISQVQQHTQPLPRPTRLIGYNNEPPVLATQPREEIQSPHLVAAAHREGARVSPVQPKPDEEHVKTEYGEGELPTQGPPDRSVPRHELRGFGTLQDPWEFVSTAFNTPAPSLAGTVISENVRVAQEDPDPTPVRSALQNHPLQGILSTTAAPQSSQAGQGGLPPRQRPRGAIPWIETCNYCNKVCSSPISEAKAISYLRNHVRVMHSSVLPFACTWASEGCKSQFYDKDRRDTHSQNECRYDPARDGRGLSVVSEENDTISETIEVQGRDH